MFIKFTSSLEGKKTKNGGRNYLRMDVLKVCTYESTINVGYGFYYIPINDTSFEMSFFWPPGKVSRISELSFSDALSLSFKMRLTLVTCFCGVILISSRDGTHDDLISSNMMT